MDVKQAVKVSDQAILAKTQAHLTDLEVIILKGAWEGKSYEEIAAATEYSRNYLRADAGRKLFSKLSEALGEKVSKTNFRTALERRWRSRAEKIPDTPSLGEKNLKQRLYIQRPPIEKQCYEAILQPGGLVRIKAPQKMGKTLLIQNLFQKIASKGYRTVLVNLLQVETAMLENLDKFLFLFCYRIASLLELEVPLKKNDYWNEMFGANINCTNYFEQYILKQIDSPLVLALDNIDRLFEYKAIYEDFFGLLRSWHEDGQHRENWKQLRMVLAYSTEVYIPLQINQSPFNVGLPMELPEFNQEQVGDFVGQSGLNWHNEEIQQLMKTIGGHPHLLEQAVSFILNHPETTLAEFLQQAPTEEGVYGDRLLELLVALRENPELEKAMKQVIEGDEAIDSQLIFQLYRFGLVKKQENKLEPRNNLYRSYFSKRL